jgi:hypothetical protein
VRVFKNKPFARFAKKAEIEDATLCDAIRDAERGLIAADLGGDVIKQRVARRGEGKSGGFRTLIVFRKGERAFFVHGFAKNEQDNITMKELVGLRELASKLLAYSDHEIEEAVASSALTEVKCDEKAIS